MKNLNPEKRVSRRKDEKIGRRDFLKLALLMVGGALGLRTLEHRFKDKSEKENKETKNLEKEKSLEEIISEINKRLEEIENNNNPINYTEDEEYIKESFKEKGKILSAYLTPIQENLEELSLDTLWENKIDYMKEQKVKEDEILEIRRLKLRLIDDYEKLPKGYVESLEEFKEYLNLVLKETVLTINLDELLNSERLKLNEEKENKLKEIFKDKNFWKEFINLLKGLILVEICYFSKEKEINEKVLEYILKKYGLRFITSIPAIHDTKISFGPFQLTELVIGSEEGKFYPINFMNKFILEFDEEIKKKYELPNYKLPDKINDLRMRGHFRAEILLLLYYLLLILKEIENKNLNEALKNKEWFYKQLIYALGGCHHLPYATMKLFLNFMSKEKIIKEKKDFIDFININSDNRNLITYLNRLKENLD